MSSQEPFDNERVVKQRDIHDQPTEAIRHTEVVHDHGEPVAVAREVDYVQSVDFDSDTVREDVAFDHVVARRAMLQRVSGIIWFVAGLVLAAIGLRVVFRLLEANEASGFVSFIYGFTEPFVRPFQGIFADPAADGAVLDSAAITAMVIYALITWAIVRFVWLTMDRMETGASRSIRERRHEHI
ncbi:MAG TPA: YggT family protein [Thermomicrobiales bacterium]|nr:YggT family protein [Thermomicrobiales bacterium]